LGTAAWEIYGKIERANVKCPAWNQATGKILVVLLCLLKFTSLLICGGASIERAEDDTADGSPEERPESTESAMTFESALNSVLKS